MASKLNKSKGSRGRNTPKMQPRSRINKAMKSGNAKRVYSYKSNPGY